MIIEDKRLQVKSYDVYKRTFRHISTKILNPLDIADVLVIPPEQNAPRNMLNVLNDDCLCEIFKKTSFFDT